MITLQHSLVTLFGYLGHEDTFEKEAPYVLFPDAIRRYCGPRQYSHFEEKFDGSDISWVKFPSDIKSIDKEKMSKQPMHMVDEVKPCVIGEKTHVETFEEHNEHLSPEMYAGIKKHLIQDTMFDEFIREKIDCSRKYEDIFVFNDKEYNGQEIRKLIADIENQGVYVLAWMLNRSYGITTNQEWFDKHVKEQLDKVYPEDLAEGTYKYMKIPDVINERITNGDWSHLDEGPLKLEEYTKMYMPIIKAMPQVDFERADKQIKLAEKNYKGIEEPE